MYVYAVINFVKPSQSFKTIRYDIRSPSNVNLGEFYI